MNLFVNLLIKITNIFYILNKKGTMPDEHLSLYLSLCDRYQA